MFLCTCWMTDPDNLLDKAELIKVCKLVWDVIIWCKPGELSSQKHHILRRCTGGNSLWGLAKLSLGESDFIAGSATILAHIVLQGI